jgi:protein TonB
MVSNNLSRVSVLEFATSFGVDNSLLKKAYILTIFFITLMFWIVFPQGKVTPPQPPPDSPVVIYIPKDINDHQKPPTNIVLVKVNAPVIPDPTPEELEPPSDYIYDGDIEYDATYEGDWTYLPEGPDAREVVKVSKPECYEKTQPYYPELARKAGIEGTVVVKIIIGTDSRISEAVILKSPGKQFGFDDAALNALKQWRCNPAMIDGRKMETEGVVSVNFRITR